MPKKPKLIHRIYGGDYLNINEYEGKEKFLVFATLGVASLSRKEVQVLASILQEWLNEDEVRDAQG